MRLKHKLGLLAAVAALGLVGGAQAASAAPQLTVLNGGAISGNAAAAVVLGFAGGTTVNCTTATLGANLANARAAAYPITLAAAATWTFPAAGGACTAGGGGGATTFACARGDIRNTAPTVAGPDTTPMQMDMPCTLTTVAGGAGGGACTATLGGFVDTDYSNLTQRLMVYAGSGTLTVTRTTCAALFPVGMRVSLALAAGGNVTYQWPANLRMLSAP